LAEQFPKPITIGAVSQHSMDHLNVSVWFAGR
jgi:hypothetical protein